MPGRYDPKPDKLDDIRGDRFVRRVAARAGVGQATTAKVLVGLRRELLSMLAENQRVVWAGFGTFFLRPRKAARRKNTLGEIVDHEATETPTWVPSARFTQHVKEEREQWRS